MGPGRGCEGCTERSADSRDTSAPARRYEFVDGRGTRQPTLPETATAPF
jgi:hypothetical protein